MNSDSTSEAEWRWSASYVAQAASAERGHRASHRPVCYNVQRRVVICLISPTLTLFTTVELLDNLKSPARYKLARFVVIVNSCSGSVYPTVWVSISMEGLFAIYVGRFCP